MGDSDDKIVLLTLEYKLEKISQKYIGIIYHNEKGEEEIFSNSENSMLSELDVPQGSGSKKRWEFFIGSRKLLTPHRMSLKDSWLSEPPVTLRLVDDHSFFDNRGRGPILDDNPITPLETDNSLRMKNKRNDSAESKKINKKS